MGQSENIVLVKLKNVNELVVRDIQEERREFRVPSRPVRK